MTLRVAVARLSGAEDMELPAYASAGAAGMDLRAAVTDVVIIEPGDRALIPTGIALALPWGTEGQIRPRSGLAFESGITVLNAPGTIDSDYRGEVKVLLANLGPNAFTVERGMRIAQLVVARVERVELAAGGALPDSGRSSGGFGSTGGD